MDFYRDELKASPLVKQAYDYLIAKNKIVKAEILASYQARVYGQLDQKQADLEEARDLGQYTQEEYEKIKASLDAARRQYGWEIAARADQEARAALQQALTPAEELERYADKAPPELIAAALLSAVVRDPADYLDVTQKFGPGIAGVAAELLHIQSYPTESAALVAAAGADAKRILLAAQITPLAQAAQAAAMGQQLQFPPNTEKELFKAFSSLWGVDKGLDKRVVDVFNSVAEAASSEFRFAVGGAGELTLQSGVPPIPRAPKPGRNNKPPFTGS